MFSVSPDLLASNISRIFELFCFFLLLLVVLSTAHFCLTFCFGVKFDMWYDFFGLVWHISALLGPFTPLPCAVVLCVLSGDLLRRILCVSPFPKASQHREGPHWSVLQHLRPSGHLFFLSLSLIAVLLAGGRCTELVGEMWGEASCFSIGILLSHFFKKYLLFFIYFFIHSIVLFCFTRCCTVDRITKTNLCHCFILYYLFILFMLCIK